MERNNCKNVGLVFHLAIVSTLLWTKTIISLIYLKYLNIRNKTRKNLCSRITLAETNLTTKQAFFDEQKKITNIKT